MTSADPQPSGPRRGLSRTAARAGAVSRAALRAIRGARWMLARLLEALLAVVIVFEEWGWRPLADALARLHRFAPIARLEAAIAGLPPYPALLVFAAPSLLVLPLKLLSFWLIAHGHLVVASLLFAGAKVAGTALVARIFQLTQPALMRLAWFARAYNFWVPWKEALLVRIRASRAWRYGRLVKARLMRAATDARRVLVPVIAPLMARLRAWLGRSTPR